ncbi:unnamed protein product [Discula destructiva]
MKRSRASEDEDDVDNYSDTVAAAPISKIINLDAEGTGSQANKVSIQCSLPGHAKGASFTSYGEYEKHYAQVHSNRCHECGKNFPTSHMLSLHIQEHHDALSEMQREKGRPTYACFVEVCEHKFQSYGERQEHLIKDHTYPENYFFAVAKFGLNNKRQSMLVEHRKERKDSDSQRKTPHHDERKPRKPKGHAAKPEGDDNGESRDVQMTDVETPVKGHQEPVRDTSMTGTPPMADRLTDTKDVAMDSLRKAAAVMPSKKREQQDPAVVDTEMEDLAGAMSSLKFVPRSIRLAPKQKPRR